MSDRRFADPTAMRGPRATYAQGVMAMRLRTGRVKLNFRAPNPCCQLSLRFDSIGAHLR
jgi:hypothetical protein